MVSGLREDSKGLSSSSYKLSSINKDSTDVVNSNVEKDGAISKAEKLRRRQERLANSSWMQKIRDQQKQGTSDKVNNDSIKLEETKKKRLEKFEEWKRKRLENGKEEPKNIPKSRVFNLKIIKEQGENRLVREAKDGSRNNSEAKKRSIFDDGVIENESHDEFTSKKPKSTYENNEKKEDSDIDELEVYLKELEEKENSSSSKPNNGDDISGNVSSEDEEIEPSEHDDQSKQQEILEHKLKKLQNKGKELDVIDHNTVNYLDFRKNLYKESEEIGKLSEEEIKEIRSRLDGIKVRGQNCPRPVLKWLQLGLPTTMMSIIEDVLHYEKPSSIQSQALPVIMSGRDMIGIAKTGSGKTLSFVLPMLRQVQDQPPLAKDDGPIGLVISPTRELAVQIYKEVSNFTKKLGISACCCCGGSPIESQIAELKRGVEILVGTPGRIIDILAANSGRVTNLRRVTYLVLDEADRMFDLGFEPQVMRICNRVRPDKQTVLFSATFPRKMQILGIKILNNPIEIIAGGISVVAAEISQKVECFVPNEVKSVYELKIDKLLQSLGEFFSHEPESKILIFVDTQRAADDLLVRLLAHKYASLAIHGGKDQVDRSFAIKEFSSPKSGINILVATSIAARGLDVKGLNLVVNFDPPNHMEDYVHRVGRTGRAGMTGTAITFLEQKQERAISDVVKAIRASEGPDAEIDPRLLEISNRFSEKIKEGKEKMSSGFGGKGLENLQEIRDNNRNIERKVYGDDDQQETPSSLRTPSNLATKSSAADDEVNKLLREKYSQLPDFVVIEGRAPETSGPDKCKFHSRVTINDLPQKARWITVNRDSLSRIIDSTGVSITNKGQYYPPNQKIPKGTNPNDKESLQQPKLYLLVEGLTESSVQEAVNLLRDRMIEGLEVSAKEESLVPSGRYKV